MKKIIITGGAGYIGSVLAKKLLLEGESITIIDNLSYGKNENIPEEANFYEMDILSPEIEKIFQKVKPDVVYHLAASKSVNESLEKPLEFSKTNILGSINVINAAVKSQVEKLVFTSTAAVYGNHFTNGKQIEEQIPYPSSPYGWTKLAIEQYITYINSAHNKKYVTVRFANVYGPGGKSQYKSAVDTFIEQLQENKQLMIHGDGTQTRDFVFIKDLVDFCSLLKDADFDNHTDKLIFNVATEQETTINDVIRIISQVTGITPKYIYNTHIFAGQERSLLSKSKAKNALSWQPKISLEEGIQIILDTYNR